MTDTTAYPLTQLEWGNEEIQAVVEQLQKGQLTANEQVSKFEQEFAEYVNRRYALMVNSGSSANLVALSSLFYKEKSPLRAGDEVVLPPLGWATSYSPLYQLGLKMTFVDIDLHTLNIDAQQLASAVTQETKLIMPINILGNPCPWNEILDIQQKNSCYVLEDNCESLGAQYGSRKCGSFGDLSTHSFFFAHHITTGEGGMITTDSEELYQICLMLRSHGWTRNLPKNDPRKKPFTEFGNNEYRFLLPGFNLRPTELVASAGRRQMKKVDSIMDQRRKNAEYFVSLFRDFKELIIPTTLGESSWYSFPIVVSPESEIKRETILKNLKKNGIEYRPITGGCILSHPVSKFYDYQIHNTIHSSEVVDQRGFFVGNYNKDLRAELDLLYSTIRDSL